MRLRWTMAERWPTGTAFGIVNSINKKFNMNITMKAIQITMEADLVEQVDRCARSLGDSRSAFARKALREAVRRRNRETLEQRHIEGYRRTPPTEQDFGIPEADRCWGDDAWSEE